MELTGKCFDAFRQWYQHQDFELGYDVDDELCFMDGLQDSAKYGVFVDFFDSVGIYIVITSDGFGEFGWEIDTFEETISSDLWLNKRGKSQIPVVTKANELFNIS